MSVRRTLLPLFVRRTVLTFALGLACAVTLPAHAEAQRLFARVDPYLGELSAQAGSLGSLLSVSSTPPRCQPFALAPFTWTFENGRYLAWNVASDVCIVDLLAGTVRLRSDVGGITAASRTTAAIVSGFNGSLTILPAPDAAVLTVSVPSTIPRGFGSSLWNYALLDGGATVAVLETDFSAPVGGRSLYPPVLTRVSVATGAIIDQRSLPWPIVATSIAASPSGDRLALVSADVYGSPGGLLVIDPASLALLAFTTAITPAAVGTSEPAVHWASSTRLVVWTSADTVGDRALELLDASTLTRVTRLVNLRPAVPLAPGFLHRNVRHQVHVDPMSALVLVAETEVHDGRTIYDRRLARATLSAFDAATASRRGTTALDALYGGAAIDLPEQLFVISPPGSPTGLAATTSGSTVTLSWTPVAGATHYVLEGGSAPGLANLATVTLAGTSLAVPGVPRGTYHLRVRAVGVGGQGPRSADIRVAVN